MLTKLQLHLAAIFVKIFYRDRQAIFFSLLFPLIFTGIFLFSDGEPDPLKLGLVNESNNELSIKFVEMVKQEKFLEYAKVFDYSYGTLKSEIDTKIINGINVIVDIDWQGTRQIEQHIPDDIVKIFILPPSINELEKRLGARATESQDSFKKRMSEARKEISHYSEYDFIIINEDIQESVSKIKTILHSESLRKRRQVGLDEFVDNLI